ncbi:MAG: LytR/AlgR family response regulator transcription factor [Saprospiraceae bacterium]
MMTVKCLLVDDEPLAMEVLESYIAQVPNLELVGKCDNALQAYEVLRKNEIDLIFLDIEMPQLSGIEFINTLENVPSVIFTTAHRHYAFEGYELDVLDFLLKPVSFGRFLKAINKLLRANSSETETEETKAEVPEMTNDKMTFIYVKEDKKMVKIYLENVVYIESLKDYVCIHTDTRKVITKQQISYLEQKLPEDDFMRIHRSFIISTRKIKAFNSNQIELEGQKELPIGRSYKPVVLEALTKNGYEL